jgi:maleate isomerase
MSTWKPDGSGWRARIGVLTHDDSTVEESEFWTMAPDGVSVHAARVPFGDLRTYSDPPGPDNATEQLARLPLQGIVFAFTTGRYVLGTTGEQELVARLEKHSNGIPVIMPCVAAVAAFQALADNGNITYTMNNSTYYILVSLLSVLSVIQVVNSPHDIND